MSFPQAAISHPRPPLGPALGPPNAAPLAAAGTRQFLTRTTFPASLHMATAPFSIPKSHPQALASASSWRSASKWLWRPRAGIPFSPQQTNLNHGNPGSGCAWGATAAPEQSRGVSLCKPSLSEPGFEVQSPTHVFKQRPRLHSSIGSAAPAMRRSPSRCFQPGSQASCCTAASCRAGAALGREQR